MADLDKMYNIVMQILTDNERARDDDMYLYALFAKIKNLEICSKPFYEVMERASEFGLPSFESVSRARRKVQAEHIELKASEHKKSIRGEYEQMFLEWARG